jgi:hypothetical protein
MRGLMLEKQRERIFFAVIALVALFVVFRSYNYEIGTIDSPKMGFFPFIIGVAILILSLGMYIFAKAGAEKQAETVGRNGLIRVASFIVAIVIYAVFLEQLGFLVGTFLLLVFLVKLMGQPGWGIPLLFSLICVTICWMLFKNWLGLPLPAGIISF